MPFLSKRKKQLQQARDSKRQKHQELENQDPEQEGCEEEALESLSDYESENDDFQPENEVLDDETMIHLYCSEWIDDLHRDDLMSLTIVLLHLLVTTLHFPLTRAAQLIAELVRKSNCTVQDWRATFLAETL